MAQSNGDELLNGLDTTSEYNIKFGRGHGDLKDACHICGISPAMLKEAILADRKQHELDAKISVYEKIKQESSTTGEWEECTKSQIETIVDEHIAELKAELERLG